MQEIEEVVKMIETIGFPMSMCILLLILFAFCFCEAKKVIERNTDAIMKMAVANEKLAQSVYCLSRHTMEVPARKASDDF